MEQFIYFTKIDYFIKIMSFIFQIDTIASFKHLKNIAISELLIAGNPIVQHCYNYTHQLNDILPLLSKIVSIFSQHNDTEFDLIFYANRMVN